MIEWDDIVGIIGALIFISILLLTVLFLSNNYIGFREQSKAHPITYPIINDTKYMCQPDSSIHWSWHIYWNYWYVYIIILIMMLAALLFLYSILTFN
jgi:predicted ferric reductase